MNDKYKINENVNIMYIDNDKFKTNIITVYFKRPLRREDVTKNSLLPYVLRSSTISYKTKLELDNKLQDLYSSNISVCVEKEDEKHILSFSLSTVSDKYLPESISKEAVNILKEIIFMPNIENNGFIKQYVDIEKNVLAEDIKSEINNKGQYAFAKATELMFKGEPFSIKENGYLEDLETIDEFSLYEYYKEFISTSPIDIVIAGQFDKEDVINYIKAIFDIKINPVKIPDEKLHLKSDFKKKEEKMDITQAKLVLGYSTQISVYDEDYYDFVTFVNILGGGVFSKLFNNVREKHSLCYSISSILQKSKGTIMIASGIEPENKNKAIELINKQIEDMKEGIISPAEFEGAKKYYIHALNTLYDSLQSLSDFYYFQSIRKSPKTIEELIEIMKNIKKEDVQKAAKKCEWEMEYFLTKK